ncbi:hypothetical protein NADE_008510 [Nannochloris sp. 'desiccata']|nr:hypothetical protein NADE_008510 [Chlorella desiccata (nom. nud.)]
MGILCSKQSKHDPLGTLSPRISPFGRFTRRISQQSDLRRTFVREGTLLVASLDTLCKTLHLQSPVALCQLPADLAQLLLDRLVQTGKLNDASVLRLQGQAFYQLRLDSYPNPIRDFWVRFLITESIEVLDLSRTQIDNFMLSSVPYLPKLHTLRLECCDGVTDGGLVVLQRFPALKELSLAGCDSVGPLGLGCIARIPSLCRLNLDACHKVWGLGPLRRLTQLEALDLGWCNAIGDEDAAALGCLTSLKQLCLSRTELTDVGVSKLSSLIELTCLSLAGVSMQDSAAAELLPCFPKLKSLNLSRCVNVGDATLHALAHLGDSTSSSFTYGKKSSSTSSRESLSLSLEELDLSYTSISDEALFSILPRLLRLKKLSLDSCSLLTDTSLKQLSSLQDLESLDLSDTAATNISMVAISRLPRIVNLNLSFTQVNDWGLERVSKASTLKRLNLDSRHVGDRGIGFISQLPNLEVLDLFGAGVTDAACAFLAKATSLTSLEICSGVVTDTGVSHVSSLPKLRHLSLSQNWRVSNAAIPALMRLRGLTALNLSQTRVTSSAVVTFGCLPDLQVLALAGTKVKPPAVEKLHSMNPDLEVRGVAMPNKIINGSA